MKKNTIRPLAVGLIKHKGKYLVIATEDKKIGKKFFRAPGGGIEFGETGVEALEREMREEFAVEISKVEYLGTIENLFEFEKKKGHEICLVYEAKISDKLFLNKDKAKVLDSATDYGVWVTKKDFKQIPFYPDGIINYI